MKWRVLAATILLTSLGGCAAMSFYWQAINGQWELSRESRPIEAVIEDGSTQPGVRDKLRTVQAIRAFAVSQLALPDNKSYRKYADLKRPYVVWNVFATAEFSVIPKEWCFPFVGCVGYRGYFREADARAFGERLRQEGVDVFVGGVPAYSTLGYFDDPVLNTFIGYPETEVARLIFHELAHQVVFVKGDSTFNESFATAVEQEGVKRWIAHQGSAAQQQAFDVAQARKAQFLQMIESHRARLRDLYDQPLSEAEKRARKARIFDEMRAHYLMLKQQWGGFAGYDFWMNQPLNNAQLASLSIYTQMVPGFQVILARVGHDMKRFYDEVGRIAKLPQAQRHQELGLGES